MIKEPVSTCVSLPGLWNALSFEGLSPKLAHTSLLAGGPAPLQPSAFFFCWALSPQPLVFQSLCHASPSSCHTLPVSTESQLLFQPPGQGLSLSPLAGIVVIAGKCITCARHYIMNSQSLLFLKVLLFNQNDINQDVKKIAKKNLFSVKEKLVNIQQSHLNVCDSFMHGGA